MTEKIIPRWLEGVNVDKEWCEIFYLQRKNSLSPPSKEVLAEWRKRIDDMI